MTSTPPARPVVVPGERVFLSHVLPDDVPLFAQWFADLELTALLGLIGTSFTAEQEQRWFAGLAGADETTRTFAIIARDGGRPVGSCGLREIDHRHGTAELGIAIGDKAAWGQGYGSEAVRLLADYGITFLGLHNIRLWLHAYNERAQRAYLRAGFQEAGRLRGATLVDGRRYDRVLMDITRADLGPSRLIGLISALADKG